MTPLNRKSREMTAAWLLEQPTISLRLPDGVIAAILLFVAVGIVWLAVLGMKGMCFGPMPLMIEPTPSVTVPALKDVE